MRVTLVAQKHSSASLVSRSIGLVSTRRNLTQTSRTLIDATSSRKPTPVNLARAFDDGLYWESINRRNGEVAHSGTMTNLLFSKLGGGATAPKTGLFNNPYLHSPKGLKQFTKRSLSIANSLVETLRTDKTPDGLLKFIVRLDQLSDTLCRVIDLCEFIRSAHPSEAYISVAQECHEEMFEFMNILNTDVNLCNTLKQVLSTKEIVSKLTQEELKVGKILLEDFEKSGIYMSTDTRDRFIEMSQDISLVGQDFINNTNWLRSEFIEIASEELDNSGVSPILLRQLTTTVRGTHYKVPAYGTAPYIILRSCKNENARKAVWTALHSCPDKQINRLTHMVKMRSVLSNIMGKVGFAVYQLQGKMAKSPENVLNFITRLMEHTKPMAAEELKLLANMKLNDLGLPEANSEKEILETVRPWDRDYYVAKSQQTRKAKNQLTNHEPINAYFTLGSVLEGLSNLFKSIYGISLEVVASIPGETWSSEVRRVNVKTENNNIIGVVYCDLFERKAKTSSPAHFTVCCSRELYAEENDPSILQSGVNSRGEKFQLPIISLVCNFARTSDNELCLLQLSEIETLFHEMGHAMHSMLGQTKLQNISGTRCTTDFVELPSIIMEHFARDPRVLKGIGRHYITKEKVPEDLLAEELNSTRYLQNCETFAQAKMAMLDQRLYDNNIIFHVRDLDVVELYHDLERNLEVLVDDQTNWCGKFGHLFGYGATYYSYLLDRAIAAKIWDCLFVNDPFSRTGGENFKNAVLKWGGLRDPWECIADVLDQPMLKKGDTKAMEYIAQADNI
ncbi:metalloendopeptidase KNAG_0A06200 [Huiozyma naganishii CBS 8797]|uniref:Mitochondrial intermediate peptidase n=1 Tax=Huiozyma naganishii (strain ATCC MYA-139 / BCRC 22969 / CBS 8797 / KCTC 17520 / NBRC 10181 / NCYC 3082 / Yp74L-3) TaxID=1071383 RepID=J7S3Y9_HUIN7|nr:hypothetical protein KNAG_0A06200 [Kazachstania naganishii CBS 8797]CCK68281.1 hypothetical protein KNAG_0A06200 [Kazachstania naganishii CBS 8797]